MKTRELNAALAVANPVDSESLDGLELEAMEAELLADISVSGAPAPELGHDKSERRRPRWRFAVALGGLVTVATAAIVLLLGGGASESPSKAYGAELIRFAESTPLLLLEGPGWRVENANEEERREGTAGTMEFVTGKPIPDEAIQLSVNGVSGMAPPSVRQRKVELSWRHGKLAFPAPVYHPISLPVLGTTASVNTHAGEIFVITKAGKRVFNRGRPGDRTMAAIWREGSLVLELRAAVPNQVAFEERLGWLTKVDSETWLDAMPAKVVKAADHDATVREMLKGIPLPATFTPSRIPNTGLTTNRNQVAGTVTNTVSCLWFRQWGDARRTGDRAAELEAESAMASSRHWPILREMAKEGGQPLAWKLAAAMPSGYWEWHGHQRSLLAHAEGLGCARLGLPLLPRKQKLQRERGAPLPPR